MTCAKLLAAVYARLGKDVQAFGDYAGERSGAPVRAFVRASDEAIRSRNKVYEPHHLLVLDPTLLAADVVSGLEPGGLLLVNTAEPPDAIAARFGGFRAATLDATEIARRQGIGTRTVVIVNTTMAGAFVRALGLQLDTLRAVYEELGLISNFEAAKEAYDVVRFAELDAAEPAAPAAPGPSPVAVEPIVVHTEGPAPALKTGNWRSQTPSYSEKLAPCSVGCPAGNDVVGFLQKLVLGEADGAAALLGRTQPLASVCGRVCPAFCMEACNRVELDGSVHIRALERGIGDSLAEDIQAPARAPAQPAKRRSVAVVGGGPAGLAAAWFLALRGHDATIYETEKELGGVLYTGIPTYRLPREVTQREVDAVLSLGVKARCGETVDGPRLAALAEEHDGVIVATGLQWQRPARVSGEDLEGVEQGLDFLRRVNLEGGVKLSGHAVVLGGGNTAMDCARSAVRCGAESVTVAYRRSRVEMPAIKEEIHEAEEEGVDLKLLRQPVAFEGNGRLEGVVLAEVELGEHDASGRRRPIVTDRTTTFPCDTVLLALGQGAELEWLPEGWEVEDGRAVKTGEALPVFFAGDVATGDGTVAHAIGHGRRVAGLVLRALGEEVEVFERQHMTSAVPATDIKLDHFAKAPPAEEDRRPVAERIRTFDEVALGLPGAAEADRCFSCGHCNACDTCIVYCPDGVILRSGDRYEIDYDYCKGCAICVHECPRSAIEMVTS